MDYTVHSTPAAAYPLADGDFHRVSCFLDASRMSHRWCSKQRRTLYSFSPTKPSVITKIPSTHSADATLATILASPPEPAQIPSAHGKARIYSAQVKLATPAGLSRHNHFLARAISSGVDSITGNPVWSTAQAPTPAGLHSHDSRGRWHRGTR